MLAVQETALRVEADGVACDLPLAALHLFGVRLDAGLADGAVLAVGVEVLACL